MHPYLLLLLRLFLGSVWIAAALAKLQNPRQSARAVTAFGILPERALLSLGFALPFVELALGIAFITGTAITWAAVISIGLLAAFSVAISINLLQGKQIECNCFGQIGKAKISWWSVGRNALLLLAATLAFLWPSDYATLPGWLAGAASRSVDPPLVEFIPVLLLALGAVSAVHLGISALELARVVARAEDGPALGLPERVVLRRWFHYATDSSMISRNGR